jgi:hypothetical protein
MKITGKGLRTGAVINGVTIKNGTHKYNFDSKDPLTAFQLDELVKMGLIECDEGLSPELVKETEKALNAGTLIIDTEDQIEPTGGPQLVGQHYKSGPRKFKAYKGSRLPDKKKVKSGPTAKAPGKSTKKPRKN